MIILLFGEDTYRSREKLNEILTQFKQQDPSGMNLAVLDMSEKRVADFSKAATALPFMAKKRLVVAKNFLSAGQAKEQEVMAKMITDNKIPIETTVIFFEYQKVDKRKKLFKLLKKSQQFQEFNLLAEYEVAKWLTEEIARRQGKMEPAAITKLASYIGNDLWKMSNELDKLILYRNRELIRAEDIDLLVKARLDENIFNLVDVISQGNKKLSLKLLHDHFEQGQNEQYLLSMIAYQFRNLAQVKPLLDQGMPLASIKKEVGLHPFVIKKASSQARRFSLEKIKRIYDVLVRTDLAMKTGKVDQKTALDLLVVSLCG